MNNKDQENGTWKGPLIFTVPAYGFVMALYLDWLNGTNRAAFAAKTFAEGRQRDHGLVATEIHGHSQGQDTRSPY